MSKKIMSVLFIGFAVCILASCASKSPQNGGDDMVSPSAADVENTEDVMLASTLKDAYKNDFHIGVATNLWTLSDEDEGRIITDNFDNITWENAFKPEGLLDQEASKGDMPAINEKAIDEMLDVAKKDGLLVRGHCLIWHNQTPEWFFAKDFDAANERVDKATMKKRMENYIKLVITYCEDNYPGVVYAWDVVNEACLDEGGYRTENPWYEIYEDESYIEDAFAFARKYASKDVKLFYNDYNEYMNDKMSTIKELLYKLKEQGNIDGMGFQSHWDMDYPSPDDLKNALISYAELGLEIHLTEIDMHNTDSSDDGLKLQADRYSEFFKVITEADRKGVVNITDVTFWGLKDDESWLTNFKGEESYPLLFDMDGEKKPCYDAILKIAKQ